MSKKRGTNHDGITKKPLTFCQTILYNYARQKKEVKYCPQKQADNPRPHKISIRINDESKEILEEYCQNENVSKTEAIERGIKRLKPDIKK